MSNLYIDVEAIPSQRQDVAAYLAAKAMTKESRKGDDASLTAAAKAGADMLRDTSLQPHLGELAVVSIALDDNDPITYVRDLSDPQGERRLIDAVCADLWGMFRTVSFRQNLQHIVAHNAQYDRTMLRTRCMVHRMTLPAEVHALGVKPWDSRWYCTQEALRTDFRSYVSLDEACLAFGVPLMKGDIDGSKVWDAILAGRIDDVARYCADDVRRVRAVYQAIQGVRFVG